MNKTTRVGAIIVAAGQSRRMGSPKMLLPWGSETVIERVVNQYLNAGIEPVVVVTGPTHAEISGLLDQTSALVVQNERYMQSEMLQSVQVGLTHITGPLEAVFIGLGDQPQISTRVIKELLDDFMQHPEKELIIPSHQMRRGHPWLIKRSLWDDILSLGPDESLRVFLSNNTQKITYCLVDSPEILADLDTPEDYQKQRPD